MGWDPSQNKQKREAEDMKSASTLQIEVTGTSCSQALLFPPRWAVPLNYKPKHTFSPKLLRQLLVLETRKLTNLLRGQISVVKVKVIKLKMTSLSVS